METTAVRLYGLNDIRLETFELPQMKDDEILMKVVCDSVCMTTHKTVTKGYWLIQDDIAENPCIIGHEFAGVLVKVGDKWKDKYTEGETCAVQIVLKDISVGIAGYSMPYSGGDATYVILKAAFMEQGNLLKFNSDFGFYSAAMAEPICCNIGAFHSMYHTKRGRYVHDMGIVQGGNCAMFASCGPMGMGGIGYLLNCDRKPGMMVVTDIDDSRLKRAEVMFSKEYAKERGVEIHFLNTAKCEDPQAELMALTGEKGYNDVSVYAPVKSVIELADSVLAPDGCLNFFSGPIDKQLKAELNFYNVHYNSTHIVGTSGGNKDDMKEYLGLSSIGKLNPAFMITHIGGMGAVVDTVLNLPSLPGGKKLIYTHVDLPLIAIDDFAKLGETDPFFAKLAELVENAGGVWCVEAERYLLENKSK